MNQTLKLKTMNFNLHLNPDLTRFPKISAEKMHQLNSPFNGKKTRESNSSNRQEKNNQKESQQEKAQDQDQQSNGNYARWVRILAALIFVGLAIPFLTWLFKQFAALVRSARDVENAFY
jgi:hypothetical protein